MAWYNPFSWGSISPEEALPLLQEQGKPYGLTFQITTGDKGKKVVALTPEGINALKALKQCNRDDKGQNNPDLDEIIHVLTGNHGGVELKKENLNKLAELAANKLPDLVKKASAPEMIAGELEKKAGKYGLHFQIVKGEDGTNTVQLDSDSKQKFEALVRHNLKNPAIATDLEKTADILEGGAKGEVKIRRLQELNELKDKFPEFVKSAPTPEEAMQEGTAFAWNQIQRDIEKGDMGALQNDFGKIVTTLFSMFLAPKLTEMKEGMIAGMQHQPDHPVAPTGAPAAKDTVSARGVG